MVEFERNNPVTPSIVIQYSACETIEYKQYAYQYLLSNVIDHFTNGIGECLVKFYVKYLLQKWTVFVGPGYTIRYLNICHTNLTGNLVIYDGQLPRDILYKYVITKESRIGSIIEIDTSTKYMKSVIAFDILTKQPKKISRKFAIQFRRIFSTNIKLLPLNSLTTIKHNGDLLHAVFSIQSLNGNYPNLTLNVRSFFGFNEGACSHGGFLLRQPSLIGKSTDRNHGPYCKGSSHRCSSCCNTQ